MKVRRLLCISGIGATVVAACGIVHWSLPAAIAWLIVCFDETLLRANEARYRELQSDFEQSMFLTYRPRNEYDALQMRQRKAGGRDGRKPT